MNGLAGAGGFDRVQRDNMAVKINRIPAEHYAVNQALASPAKHKKQVVDVGVRGGFKQVVKLFCRDGLVPVL